MACLFFGFTVITHSLAFVLGNAEVLSDQASATLIIRDLPLGDLTDYQAILFTRYPPGSSTRFRECGEDFDLLCGLAAASVFLIVASDRIFKAGLRKYESETSCR